MRGEPTLLTADILKVLAKADTMVIHKSGNRYTLTAYPRSHGTEMHTTLEVAGRITRGIFGDDSSVGSCTCHVHNTDVFKLLKVGDRISVEFWPDCNSPFLVDRGLTRDTCTLVVTRNVGTALKPRSIFLNLMLAEQVTDPGSTARICRGFPPPKRADQAA